MNLRVPAGYTRYDEPSAIIVARTDVGAAVQSAYRAAPADRRTLHGYASGVSGAIAFEGRATAFAIPLPSLPGRVVVRHNRHGGALRRLTGDLFVGATRAPRELDIALRLKRVAVATPTVLAYAIYPAFGTLSRSDVLTEQIGDSLDLGTALLATPAGSPDRDRIWGAVMRLLRRLAAAGIRHHDLNVKNILIRRADDERAAYVLDVDRIEFDCTRRDAYAGNRARLRRSIEKWRRLRGLTLADREAVAIRGSYLAPDARTTSS
jgi:tRNA A-37 threonylcarbamoyl transferase component Bud32